MKMFVVKNIKHLLLFVFCISHVNIVISAKRKAQGKVKYELNWISEFQSCDDFVNNNIDFSKIVLSKDSKKQSGFSGEIIVLNEILEDTQIEIRVEKETLLGKQFMYLIESDFCSHLADEDMPWSSIIQATNLDPKDCPIPAKTYSLKECNLNMAFMEKVLSHQYVGQYQTKVTLTYPGKGLALAPKNIGCFMIATSVDETREEDEIRVD